MIIFFDFFVTRDRAALKIVELFYELNVVIYDSDSVVLSKLVNDFGCLRDFGQV